MKFFRVYIEITNVCALKCSFCPQKKTKPQIMDLALFEKIIGELTGKTKEIAFHIMGDPLLNKNLKLYLDLAYKFSHKVSLTTSGFYLSLHEHKVLMHSAISQLNISLNSFDKNSKKMTLQEYMSQIFSLVSYKLEHNENQFINLRLWNLTQNNSTQEFNRKIFDMLEQKYNITIDGNLAKKESFRVAKKVRVHFDELFSWPSLTNDLSQNSPCHGLNSQLGILSNGTVVPCCLDYDGKVALGDVNSQSLYDIVTNAKHIAKGLKDGFPTEELCQKCSYRLRFQ
ncbi:MAG: SPASM domain-containing protein [Campylobacteraceae bacterium]|jgi:radical SAM protein with 4Fe4S-binding SPASM domain|nr:SPASM domain-containing protein [Campylobacteraceae bacterium]